MGVTCDKLESYPRWTGGRGWGSHVRSLALLESEKMELRLRECQLKTRFYLLWEVLHKEVAEKVQPLAMGE